MRTWTARLTLLAAALVMGAFVAGAQTADAVKFAVTDIAGLEELQSEFGAFKDVLQEETGFEIDFYALNSRTAAVEALNAKKVNFVLTGPAEYVVIRKRTNAYPSSGSGAPTTSRGSWS